MNNSHKHHYLYRNEVINGHWKLHRLFRNPKVNRVLIGCTVCNPQYRIKDRKANQIISLEGE